MPKELTQPNKPQQHGYMNQQLIYQPSVQDNQSILHNPRQLLPQHQMFTQPTMITGQGMPRHGIVHSANTQNIAFQPNAPQFVPRQPPAWRTAAPHQADMMSHQNIVYPPNYTQAMGSTSNVQYAPNMPAMAYAQPGFHQQPQQYVVLPQGYQIQAQQLQQQQHPQQQQVSMNNQIPQVPASMPGYAGQYSQAHMHNMNQAPSIATTMASPSNVEKPALSRERVSIRLVDPESGKDVLSEIRATKKKDEKKVPNPYVPPQSVSSILPKEPEPTRNSAIPSNYVDTTGQDKRIAAQFAAQVAAAAASSTTTTLTSSISKPVFTVSPQSSTTDTVVQNSTVSAPQNNIVTESIKASNGNAVIEQAAPKPTEAVAVAVEKNPEVAEELNDAKAENELSVKEQTSSKTSVKSEEPEVKPIPDKIETEIQKEPASVQEIVSEQIQTAPKIADAPAPEKEAMNEITTNMEKLTTEEIETPVAEQTKVDEPTSVKEPEPQQEQPLVDESAKAPTTSAFSQVVPKKNKKNSRMKKINSKESGESDMLSAFTDKPEPAEPSPELKVEEPAKPAEDATWEDKETVIEKETIRQINPEIEEREIQPKIAETQILPPESEKTEDEKLQYDRDFLLKFQFAPICTRKPDDLPNMEIILDKAHAGTKALDQTQRISSNDFMPTFMRSQSGGGPPGGGRRNDSRDGGRHGSQRGDNRRGPPQQPPKKIIHIPQGLQEKAEFTNKSENAWVRPKEVTKNLDGVEKEMDEVKRSVRAVLNKLTPQKFKTLTNQIIELKINSQTKLEAAIDLIFEKAVSEPVFSVAYANMCRVLAEQYKNVPTSADESGKQQTTTFRKILLNKCQKEFEKEKENDKAIEDDKLKEFETKEEKAEWLKEIEYKEQQLRRRTRGNIRFIGELFKLKMISETIMHECVFKLLRSEGNSQEESLECLCGLLTTIGELLDHKKAKPRMDQYFNQITKIIDQAKQKGISSRIKFALRDLVELRASAWKARRDTAGPKTIDQIHKEAAIAESESQKKEQMARMQGPLPSSGQRGSQRGGMSGRGPPGRDSPNTRGGAGGAPDAWQSVPSKQRSNISQTPIDAGRFKMAGRTNQNSDSISLGPGGMRPSAWAMGASGGSSRPGSGGNTPTAELDKKNRYDILQDKDISSVPDTRRGGRGSQTGSRNSSQRGTPNGSSTPTQPRRSMPSDERSAAILAAKQIGAGQRLQSPGPARPAPQTPAPAPAASLSDEVVKKKTIATIDELLSSGTEKEAEQCILDLKCPAQHGKFVEEAINHVLERKPHDRQKVGSLFNFMAKNGTIDITAMVKGVSAVAEFAPDLACDVPLIYKYIGEVLAPIVAAGNLPFSKVKDALECLIRPNKAGIVMAEILSQSVKIMQSEDRVASMWQSSGVAWKNILKEDDRYPVEEWLQDKKMAWTQKPVAPPTTAPTSHASSIQHELFELLKNKRDNNAIFSFLEAKVSKQAQSTPEFIRDLSYAVCKSTSTSTSPSTCSCDDKQLESRCPILLKFIDRKKPLELHCLYSLQKLANDLDHPKDFLRSMCHVLYTHKVLTEDTFYTWETSKDFPEGHGVALSSLKSYLSWLREAEEESNDDELPSQQS